MGSMWTKIKKSLSAGYQNLSEKTNEMTQIGRLKIEMIAIKRDIEKAFIELGGRVYHKYGKKPQEDLFTDQDIQRVIKDIKALELKLKRLEVRTGEVHEHRKKEID
jgi:hypothetical protein